MTEAFFDLLSPAIKILYLLLLSKGVNALLDRLISKRAHLYDLTDTTILNTLQRVICFVYNTIYSGLIQVDCIYNKVKCIII